MLEKSRRGWNEHGKIHEGVIGEGGAVTHDFEGQRRSSKWIVNH